MITRSLSATENLSVYCQKYATPKSTSNSASHKLITGSIRLFSPEGDRSTVATLSVDMMAAELASRYKVDNIYMQTGNMHIRPLLGDARPLYILREYLCWMGYLDTEMEGKGISMNFRNMIAFFLGRPTLQPNSSIRSEIRMAECEVRRGKVVHRWTKHKCILYNGNIRIQRDSGEDEVLQISRYRVDIYESRKGRCLRLFDIHSTILFLFDDHETLMLWLTRTQQSEQSSSCDLSDQRLTLLPENLICSSDGCIIIRHLNLRRNSLFIRSNYDPRAPLIGWLNDINRLQSLISLDLSSNRLPSFPLSITQLPLLQKLNLSSNNIQSIPVNIKMLENLNYIDLSNNWISDIPIQISECGKLQHLNLSFNRFMQIPDILSAFPYLTEWLFAGNYAETVGCHPAALGNLSKLDLRRNALTNSFRLPNISYDKLTHIDIRDNCHVSTVHLTNVPSLQVLHCERLQLTSLHLNGQNLSHLYADHNLLESLIVMPMPLNILQINISYNNFDILPDWICDLPQLSHLNVSNNKLTALPDRIFMTPSLRFLFASNNQIQSLPVIFINECILETFVIRNNKIDQLPNELFRGCPRLRHLNLSFNRLNSLPRIHPNIDLNRIQTLRLSTNLLDESVVPIIVCMKRLKTLDLSENRLRYFDDSALRSLTLLEDLNLSSNRLSHLSPAITQLPALQVLRAHSNLILSMPDLSQSLTLQVVDLSNNNISHFDTSLFTGGALKQLDLTCNNGLNVSSESLRTMSDKTISFVDIGLETRDNETIQIGFAETSGSRNRLCIRRFRFGNVFGLIDGGSNYELPKTIHNTLKEQYQEKGLGSNLRLTILSAHEQLGEQGERLGASLLLLSLLSSIEVASVGNISAAFISNGTLKRLIKNSELDDEEYQRLRKAGVIIDENNRINGISSYSRQLGYYFLHPAISPKPVTKVIPITTTMDFVIIASWAIWDYLSGARISEIVCSTLNPQVAAKKLQDALQACDYTGNSGIIVIRLLKPEQLFDSQSLEKDSKISFAQPQHSQIPALSLNDKNVVDEATLQKIEERLEKISEVIAKIEDESNNNDDEGFLSGRQLYERILADELTQSSPHSSRSLSTIPPPDPATSREEDTKLYLKVQHEIGTENSMLRQENKHQMGISIPKLNNNLKSEHSQDNTREKFGNYSELLEYSRSGRYNIRQAEKRSLEQRHIERINQVYNYHTSIQSSANFPKAHTNRDSQSDNSLSKETRSRAPSDVFSSECSTVRIHERRMSVIDETPEQQERSENRESLKGDQIAQDIQVNTSPPPLPTSALPTSPDFFVPTEHSFSSKYKFEYDKNHIQDSLRLEIPKKDKITLDL